MNFLDPCASSLSDHFMSIVWSLMTLGLLVPFLFPPFVLCHVSMFVYLSVFVSRHRVCCFLFYFDVCSFLCLLPLSRALGLVPAVPPPAPSPLVILCVYIWSQSYLALCCVPPRACSRFLASVYLFQAYVTFTLWVLINKAAFKFSSCFPSPASWVYSSCHTAGFLLVVFLHESMHLVL